MYIERISVDGIRGFHGPRAVENLEFPLPKEGQGSWTVLAGRNGSGKTTLLRAIALGLVGPWHTRTLAPEFGDGTPLPAGTGKITVTIQPSPDWDAFVGAQSQQHVAGTLRWRRVQVDQTCEHLVSGPFPEPSRSLETDLLISAWAEETTGWFVAGYGPFRRLGGGSSATHRLMGTPGPVSRLGSLFNEDVSLAESIEWLKNLLLPRRTKHATEQARELLGFVKALLNDGLLPEDFQISRVDADGLWVERSGHILALQEISDGYRAVSAMVLDMVRQIHGAGGDKVLERHQDGTPHVVMPGVVLIDEIDAHLHVSWQKEIGGWLKKHFPNIQFIVSSHSPYICQSADPGGLIKLPGVNEERAPEVVSEDLYQRIVYGSGDDALLTDLFGIDTPYSEAAEEMRRHLGALELAVLRGKASEPERQEYVELSKILNSSLSARVDEVASRLDPG
ncbi:AAA family ATPase [Nocardiopsis valliformis]|uniref:AAA family ATPase n=1 Tax=Nocardiopsis valliformis TaxID=239974 RepID=UPI00047637ED|nr:AAA family ATPase [Nocardiopsis valliformis]